MSPGTVSVCHSTQSKILASFRVKSNLLNPKNSEGRIISTAINRVLDTKIVTKRRRRPRADRHPLLSSIIIYSMHTAQTNHLRRII